MFAGEVQYHKYLNIENKYSYSLQRIYVQTFVSVKASTIVELYIKIK